MPEVPDPDRPDDILPDETPEGRLDGGVSGSDRIEMWDVLRGFAVLGVLFANMVWMSLTVVMEPVPVAGMEGPLDTFAYWLVRLFADTKFITIFSMMFGAGLALMAHRARERGAPFALLYFRRLCVLFVIGLFHGVFLWFGDILLHYAIIGMGAFIVQLITTKVKVRWIVAAGIFFIVLSCAPATGLEWYKANHSPEPSAENQEFNDGLVAALSEGDFGAMAYYRAINVAIMAFVLTLFWGGRTFGLFLLGMALVRSGILLRPQEHKVIFRRFIGIGFLVGIPLLIVHSLWLYRGDGTADLLIRSLSFYWHGFFMAAGYTGVIALWCMDGTSLGWLKTRLSAVGRMALTNYLSHSVITAIIFNYCHQWGTWTRFEGLMLTLEIFAIQLLLSPIWLSRFRMGPVEWVWRCLTYWKRQPFRR